MTLAVGWVIPWPEAELRPWAAQLALPFLLAAAMVALVPKRKLRTAAELDTRLRFGDRLATAWAYRASSQSIVRVQRADAIARLEQRSPAKDVHWRPSRLEIGALAATCTVVLLLLATPSPQQTVLDRQAAEQLALQQASQ